MELSVMENGHTKIVCKKKEYAAFAGYINALMALYGGKETKCNNRYIYFEIFADVLNDKKGREQGQ